MAEHSTADHDKPARPKNWQPVQQLTKAMEHMRSYVTIEDEAVANKDGTTDNDTYGVPAKYAPIRKPATDSKENPFKRSDPFQFGSRFLEEGDDIFAHNAWDHVEIDPQYDEFITQQITLQRENPVSDFDKKRFNDKPAHWWDRFYSNNQANFFKDRKWLNQEFPVLGKITQGDYGPVTVLEVGAGAGNTAFPILAANENPQLRLHACDYSKTAIEIIRTQPAYLDQSPKVLQADVWDIAGTELPPDLKAGSVDVILMIFIFSALAPNQWKQALRNVHTLLKSGGEVLFRDYGRGDLAQVRFKKNRYLEDNFYVRGDGTRVYFFDMEELRQIWLSGADTEKSSEQVDNGASSLGVVAERLTGEPRFEVVNLATDRRMLVNRQRKLKMFRCWLQGHFRKSDMAC